VILLDTHVLVWLDTGSERLGATCRGRIDRAYREGEVAVSGISFWEAAMQASRGRIELSMPTSAWRRDLLAAGVREIPVDGEIGIAAATLENFHGDPADRILAATAILHRTELITADRKILAWPGALERFDATG
jgi:PIN domain nuclease of toxin-antitoxin system